MSEVEEKFKLACRYVKEGMAKIQFKDSERTLTNEEQLRMYACFKQATIGKCSEHGGERPGFFSFEAKAKWDAWSALGDMSKEAVHASLVTFRVHPSGEPSRVLASHSNKVRPR